LQTEITTRENTISNLQTDLSTEIEAARAAEDTLNKKIEKEISDRSVSEAAIINIINSEIADRVDALKAYTTTEEQQKIDEDLDKRIGELEKIDHAKLAEDASATAVATVLDGAPEKFDTLKEIAAWIAEENTAEDAASLVTRVSALEEVKDDYKGADTKLKEELEGKIETIDNHSHSNKAELDKIVDGDVTKWNTEIGAKALAESKTTTAEVKVQIEAYGYATISQVATAQQEAISDAAGKYETVGTAQEIVNELKLDKTYEPIGAETRANSYTDGKIAAEVGRADGAYSKVGHKHIVADITDYGADIANKLNSFTTTNISPILAKLAGIGGEDQPDTVIDAIIEYVDSIKSEVTPSFSIEDDTLVIG
jgi:hypothetical protein